MTEIIVHDPRIVLEVKAEDILAIGVATYEQNLLGRREDLIAQIRKASDEAGDLQKALEEACNGFADSLVPAKILRFLKAAKAAGVSCKVEHRFSEVTAEGSVTIESFLTGASVVRHASVDLWQQTKTVPAPENIQEILQQNADCKRAREVLGLELSKVIEDLRGLPSKERQLKGHLAKKALESTAEGRALLASLTEEGSPFLLIEQTSEK